MILKKKIVNHGGGYDGVITTTVLIPEIDMGFVILTNKNSSLYYALMYRILDEFLSEEESDWSTRFLTQIKAGEESQKKALELCILKLNIWNGKQPKK